MKLYDKNTGKRVRIGDTITSFRGESHKLIRLQPPHKPSSTGRIYVQTETGVRSFFPSVYYLEYNQKTRKNENSRTKVKA